MVMYKHSNRPDHDCMYFFNLRDAPNAHTMIQRFMLNETGQEPLPSPGERSNEAENTMDKCEGSACKTKDEGRPYWDLVPVVFSHGRSGMHQRPKTVQEHMAATRNLKLKLALLQDKPNVTDILVINADETWVSLWPIGLCGWSSTGERPQRDSEAPGCHSHSDLQSRLGLRFEVTGHLPRHHRRRASVMRDTR